MGCDPKTLAPPDRRISDVVPRGTGVLARAGVAFLPGHDRTMECGGPVRGGRRTPLGWRARAGPGGRSLLVRLRPDDSRREVNGCAAGPLPASGGARPRPDQRDVSTRLRVPDGGGRD